VLSLRSSTSWILTTVSLSPVFFAVLISHPQAELKSFLQFHRTGEEPLRDDEISILNGVLELNTKNVEQIMTPMKVCLSPCFNPFTPFLLRVMKTDYAC
jgi:CBS domain containing-hemolysin-like protein